MKLRTALRVASWAAILLICFVTFARADLRPHLFGSSSLDRFGGFVVLGCLLRLAYPERPRLVALLVLGGAVVLELLQLVTPDRDARWIDAAMKLAGGISGMAAAQWVLAAAARLRKARAVATGRGP